MGKYLINVILESCFRAVKTINESCVGFSSIDSSFLSWTWHQFD